MTGTRELIRPMTEADLPAAAAVSDAAFGARRGLPEGTQVFNPLLFRTRLAADPDGCFVAEAPGDPAVLTGAMFSVARGALAWFGPLAVRPGTQGGGIGQEMTAALMDTWRRRGVRLMGLETFGDSPFHVHLYSKLGFRPAWTGVSFTRPLGQTSMPPGVRTGGALPGLGYLYPGLDVSGEAAATVSCGAGVVLSTDDGVAICHLEPTFQGPQTGFVPFLAARTRESFGALMAAAEHVSREAGATSLFIRTSGSAWATMDALTARGYRAGAAFIRMKCGDDADYDRTETYYCDNWL